MKSISQYKNKIAQHINHTHSSNSQIANNSAPITTPIVIHTPTKTTVIQPHPKVQSSTPITQETTNIPLPAPIPPIKQEKVISNTSTYSSGEYVTPSISPPKTIITSKFNDKSVDSKVSVDEPKVNKEQILQDQLSEMQRQLLSEQQNSKKLQELYLQEIKTLREALQKQEEDYTTRLQLLEHSLKEQAEAHANEIANYVTRLAITIPLPNEESEVDEQEAANNLSPRLSDVDIDAQNIMPEDIPEAPSPLNINFADNSSDSEEYVNLDPALLGDQGIC